MGRTDNILKTKEFWIDGPRQAVQMSTQQRHPTNTWSHQPQQQCIQMANIPHLDIFYLPHGELSPVNRIIRWEESTQSRYSICWYLLLKILFGSPLSLDFWGGEGKQFVNRFALNGVFWMGFFSLAHILCVSTRMFQPTGSPVWRK